MREPACFRAGLQHGEARIRLSPEGRERARDLLSQAVTAAVDATAVADEDGWVTAVVPIESPPHGQSSFLGLGAEVEVVEPESLRSLMASAAAGLARLCARPAVDRLLGIRLYRRPPGADWSHHPGCGISRPTPGSRGPWQE
jgi:WYL domain